MYCCVPFCGNSGENSDRISFHHLPAKKDVRDEWLKAMGHKEFNLTESSVVCSQHFLIDDIYETRTTPFKRVRTGALPSAIQICMICLETDKQLYSLKKYKLEKMYQIITGLSVSNEKCVKQTLCAGCARTLMNFSKFRDKSLKARSLMLDLVRKHKSITLQQKIFLKHFKVQLDTVYLNTSIDNEHFDMNTLDQSDQVEQMETGKNEQTDTETVNRDIETVVVKTEKDDDYEHMDTEQNELNIVIKREKIDEDDDYPLVEPGTHSWSFAKDIENRCLDVQVKTEPYEEDDEDEPLQVKRDKLIQKNVEYKMKAGNEKTKQQDGFASPHVENKEDRAAEDKTEKNKHNFEIEIEIDGLYNNKVKDKSKPIPKPNRSGIDSKDDLNPIKIDPKDVNTSKTNKNELRYVEFNKTDKPYRDNIDLNNPSDVLNRNLTVNDNTVPQNIDNDVKMKMNPSKSDEAEIADVKLNKIDTGYNESVDLSSTSVVFNRNLTVNDKIVPQNIDNNVQLDVNPNTSDANYVNSSSNQNEVTSVISNDIDKLYNDFIEYSSASDAPNHSLPSTATGNNEAKPGRRFTCNLCNYQCDYKTNYVNHMRTHTGEKPYSCKMCDFKSAYQNALVIHVRVHTGEKPYACQQCPYRCANRSALVKHIRTHTGEKPYTCELCDYKCSIKVALVHHMRTHTGEKPYSCKLCPYKCTQSVHLVNHMKTHTGEKPFKCKLCDYKGAHHSTLRVHMRSHTGEKPFSCKFCEYKCATNSALTNHMRTHTGEKPFACTLCDYKCIDSSNLAKHMRMHTGERPYPCNMCDLKFAQNMHLVKHMQTHTGGKRIPCTFCSDNFASTSNLKRHIKNKHVKKESDQPHKSK